MATETAAALIAKAEAQLITTKQQLVDGVSNTLISALNSLATVNTYISSLPEHLRSSAAYSLSEAYTNVWQSQYWIVNTARVQLDVIDANINAAAAAYILEIKAAVDAVKIDVDALVNNIVDKTRAYTADAVSTIVNNIYSIEDTIVRLTTAGYSMMTDRLAGLFDRIPAGVWAYASKWLDEEVK
jgi:hypothetical protein